MKQEAHKDSAIGIHQAPISRLSSYPRFGKIGGPDRLIRLCARQPDRDAYKSKVMNGPHEHEE